MPLNYVIVDKVIITKEPVEVFENEDGTITITGINTAVEGVYTIPSELYGKIVTSIGAEAFKNCTTILKLLFLILLYL